MAPSPPNLYPPNTLRQEQVGLANRFHEGQMIGAVTVKTKRPRLKTEHGHHPDGPIVITDKFVPVVVPVPACAWIIRVTHLPTVADAPSWSLTVITQPDHTDWKLFEDDVMDKGVRIPNLEELEAAGDRHREDVRTHTRIHPAAKTPVDALVLAVTRRQIAPARFAARNQFWLSSQRRMIHAQTTGHSLALS